MTLWPTAEAPRLTRRTRHRLSRFLKRPILQVEVVQKCVDMGRGASVSTVDGYRWRDATAADLIELAIEERSMKVSGQR